MRRSTSRSVRYSRPRWPTVTFTEVGAAWRSRKFSMETALPPVRTVTDLFRGVTDRMDLQAQRRPDIAGDGRVSVPLGDGGELVIVPGYEHSASAALISNAQPQCA